MLAALNTKEAHSKLQCDKHDDVPHYKIGDLIMIKNLNKKLTWDAKYVPNFSVVKLIGKRQSEVVDPTGRLRKVNISDVHKILPADFIVSCIPDEQVFARKGKHTDNPQLLKEVAVIDSFLQDCFHELGPSHQEYL